MGRLVEVNYQQWIDAPVSIVKTQFNDLNHHIDANVHPKLRFEILACEPRRARFTQEVKLLGIRQRDVFDRVINDDGSIHDVSIEGFNKGATMDFRFIPQEQGGRQGTTVDVTIRLQTPPMLGWLAPLLKAQVMREAMGAVQEDKRDIEGGYRPSATMAAAMA